MLEADEEEDRSGMPPPGIDPRFAAANARGRGGLQGADGGAVETRLAAGRQSGIVNLVGS